MLYSPKWKMLAASTAAAPPLGHTLDQVVEGADAAGGDHRHAHRVTDGAGELDIEADLGAVAPPSRGMPRPRTISVSSTITAKESDRIA
jgi:hypothetical protein